MTEVYSKLITSVDPRPMNFSSRNGHAIDRIVIHHNATTNKNVALATWLQSGAAQTSAHYEVTPTEIIGCVSESDAAWHCGGTGGYDVPRMAYPNQRSIGIENVNSSGAPNWSVAHGTVVNCARLVADICKRYRIPCDRAHVLAHKEVTSTACPGGLNVNEVVNLARGYMGGKAPAAPAKPTATKTVVPTVTYALHQKGSVWLGSVVNFGNGPDGFAGNPTHQHDAFMAKVSHGSIKYRVHILGGGWLPFVTGYNTNDPYNGYAGVFGQEIDGVQIYYITPAGETPLQAWYRSQTVARSGYLGVVCDDGTSINGYTDSYAGIFGEALDRLQIKIGKEFGE